LGAHSGLVGLAIVASLLGRALAVYLLSGAMRSSRHAIELRHQHVLVWGGLKGALALALAIGLPDRFPFRDQVVVVTFGVVAFSVIVQGLTVPPLLRRLGILC
jgi:monovalent cation:H+ antiporter, CPA1 family